MAKSHSGRKSHMANKMESGGFFTTGGSMPHHSRKHKMMGKNGKHNAHYTVRGEVN